MTILTKTCNIWLVRSGSDGEAHELFVSRQMVGLGWPEIGDLRRFHDKEELFDSFLSSYPRVGEGAVKGYVSQLFRFCKEVGINDGIIYPVKGSKSIYLGLIKSDYFFRPEESDERRHLRSVEWLSIADRKELDSHLLNRLGNPQGFSKTSLSEIEWANLVNR